MVRSTLLAAFTAAALPASALATTVPVSRGLCQAPKTRPASIVLSVDGDGVLAGNGAQGQPYSRARMGKLNWIHWGSASAVAHGYEWLDDGYPSVGGGRYYKVPASITASRPSHGVFTRLEIDAHPTRGFKPNKYWTNPPVRKIYTASKCHGGFSF
ncbi:MAG: hypothetical protein J2O48_00340 [Solirubrobacterales bacterium]|nr:hypothetical protein [Solirubrobacterales bacterium]